MEVEFDGIVYNKRKNYCIIHDTHFSVLFSSLFFFFFWVRRRWGGDDDKVSGKLKS